MVKLELADASRVLEIGSGTGQHAVHFAPAMPWLEWQPSDRADNLPGIEAWRQRHPSRNLRAPLELDVNDPPPFDADYDAVFSANTAHIMSMEEVRKTFLLVADCLLRGGAFCLYGPFRRGGEFSGPGDRDFDRSLRASQAHMGIRDLEDLDRLATSGGLSRHALHALPANNLLVVWRRQRSPA